MEKINVEIDRKHADLIAFAIECYVFEKLWDGVKPKKFKDNEAKTASYKEASDYLWSVREQIKDKNK